MGELELLIRIYNTGYRQIHFLTKIITLVWYKALTALGVWTFHAASVLGYAALFLGIEFASFYCVIFQKAFDIPKLTKAVKATLLNVAKLKSTGHTRRLFGARIRSMPAIGIQVGNFHQFERMSTPNFLSFGIKNIIRVLIAFRN